MKSLAAEGRRCHCQQDREAGDSRRAPDELRLCVRAGQRDDRGGARVRSAGPLPNPVAEHRSKDVGERGRGAGRAQRRPEPAGLAVANGSRKANGESPSPSPLVRAAACISCRCGGEASEVAHRLKLKYGVEHKLGISGRGTGTNEEAQVKGFRLGTVAAVAAGLLVPAIAQAADTPSSLYDCQPRDQKAANPPPQPDLSPKMDAVVAEAIASDDFKQVCPAGEVPEPTKTNESPMADPPSPAKSETEPTQDNAGVQRAQGASASRVKFGHRHGRHRGRLERRFQGSRMGASGTRGPEAGKASPGAKVSTDFLFSRRTSSRISPLGKITRVPTVSVNSGESTKGEEAVIRPLRQVGPSRAASSKTSTPTCSSSPLTAA